MANQVPVVRVSRQYPRSLWQRPHRRALPLLTPRGKLIYCIGMVGTLGGVSLALSMLRRSLSRGEALPLAVAGSAPFLIVFLIRDPLGWRRTATSDAARGR
jgi:hypothetical protein